MFRVERRYKTGVPLFWPSRVGKRVRWLDKLGIREGQESSGVDLNVPLKKIILRPSHHGIVETETVEWVVEIKVDLTIMIRFAQQAGIIVKRAVGEEMPPS